MSNKVIPIYNLVEQCSDSIPEYFKVSSFDTEECTAVEFLEHHRHEHYEIVWLKNGNGIHHIDTETYKYKGSVLFLLSPGQVHKLNQNGKAEGYVLKFLPSLFDNENDIDTFLHDTDLFDNFSAHPVLKLNAGNYNDLEDLFCKISAEFNSEEMGQQNVLASYLKILLIHIYRFKQTQSEVKSHITDSDYSLFKRYKTAIEKNYNTIHGVQEYAEMLLTTPRSLNTITQKYSGATAGKLISERLVLEAKRYLHHGSLSIKEIAYKLGFDDPAYFTRFFKKHTGVAPQYYKMHEGAEHISQDISA